MAQTGVFTGISWLAELVTKDDGSDISQTEMEVALHTLLQLVTGIEHLTQAEAVSIGEGVCADLQTGLVDANELALQLADAQDWEPEEAGFLVGASQMALCPGTVSDRTD